MTKGVTIEFYSKLQEAVDAGKLKIEYIFLIRTREPTDAVRKFIDCYKPFAERISIVYQDDPQFTPDCLRPSIVLFQTQQFAFTHDREANSLLTEATERISSTDYQRLSDQVSRIEMVATSIYQRQNDRDGG